MISRLASVTAPPPPVPVIPEPPPVPVIPAPVRVEPVARRPRSDGRARLFVWACWAAMVGTSGFFVLGNGRNIPIQEDWHVVLAALGHQSHFWSWVWLPNNEHRVVIPKLIYVLIFQIWRDFRVGMAFNIVVLAAVSAAFLVFIRRLRGRTRWTDAFFPVVLLHLGHWENLGWSWELEFVVATAFACGLLMMVASERPWTARRATAVGLVMACIPATGATALPFAPFVGIGLILQTRGLQGHTRRIIVGFGLLIVLIAGLYFIHLPKSTWVPPSPSLWASVLTGGKLMALSLGPAAGGWWFVSILAVLGAVGLAGFVLWRARDRGAVPLLAFLLAGIALAAGLAKARAGEVPYLGLPDRYALIAVPALCAVYLAWERYGGPRLRRFGPAVLCGTIIGLLPLNIHYGAQWMRWYHERVDTFASDVKAGIGMDQLYKYRFFAEDPNEMWASMLALRNARIGVFADLRVHSKPTVEEPIDGFGAGGTGWQVLSDSAGTAGLTGPSDQRVMQWDYDARSNAPAILGRAFSTPQDWSRFYGMSFTLQGQASARAIRVRIAMAPPGQRLRLYETWFSDLTSSTQTIKLPWNAFGPVNVRGQWQLGAASLAGPMPQTDIRSLTFIITDPGPGRLLIKQVALTPGHAEIGWPLHPAVERHSLPPWS